ncbi:hypothetical protein C9439_07280, partial [archaeon SCG-AAA382B04]
MLSSFNAPGPGPLGLTYDGEHLWVSSQSAEKIYELDMNGYVISSFSSPGPVPQGLAFDGTNLWHSDPNKDSIYKISINHSPTLSNLSVSPKSGKAGTTFTFEVTYTDKDGDSPDFVKLHVGSETILMEQGGGTMIEGVIYRCDWTASPSSRGQVSYNVTASDGIEKVETSPSNLTIQNHSPILENPSVSPTSGEEGSAFTFEVTYRDNDGDQGEIEVKVGETTYQMNEVDGDYSTGMVYRTDVTLDKSGTYSYSFSASDGHGGTCEISGEKKINVSSPFPLKLVLIGIIAITVIAGVIVIAK